MRSCYPKYGIVIIISCCRLPGAGIQMSRAIAFGANLAGVDFTDTNCYGTMFDGANLEGAQFENRWGPTTMLPLMPPTTLRTYHPAYLYHLTPHLPVSPNTLLLLPPPLPCSILTNATFGKGPDGQFANLAGAHFEGALISSSDIERMCVNPTLDESTKKLELGCRKAR